VVKVIFLVMALNMDAFAVSIELGTKHAERKLSLGLMAGLYFDMFQGLMPLTGYAAGKCVLVLVGAKMMYKSSSEGIVKITHSVMII
jgi:putative Mn2+ efflux pump MntP